jgi:hypothetical protein
MKNYSGRAANRRSYLFLPRRLNLSESEASTWGYATTHQVADRGSAAKGEVRIGEEGTPARTWSWGRACRTPARRKHTETKRSRQARKTDRLELMVDFFGETDRCDDRAASDWGDRGLLAAGPGLTKSDILLSCRNLGAPKICANPILRPWARPNSLRLYVL